MYSSSGFLTCSRQLNGTSNQAPNEIDSLTFMLVLSRKSNIVGFHAGVTQYTTDLLQETVSIFRRNKNVSI